MKADWRNTNDVIAEIQVPLDDVCRKGAEMIARDARTKIPVGKDTWTSAGRSGGSVAGTHLKDQISIKESKFKSGGWIVEAQGSDNYSKYYASYIEFGTDVMNVKGESYHPYLRPAIKRNRPKIYQMWENAL